jgi:hypothetical protein
MLSLDGGGIRGVVALAVLGELEAQLRSETGNSDLVLGEWFDYVGGTSTGAIIAACLAVGMPVKQVLAFYQNHGEAMFQPSRRLQRLRSRYDDDALAAMLRDALGPDTTLGSDELRCLLLIVLRNATTDSPWPVSSNPAAMYNNRSLPDCNLDLPLWQLVRASAAAPVYFPAEAIELEVGKEHVFVDGAVTPYNNPAIQLFLMATLPSYRLEWPTGEDRLLLVSVGTGSTAIADPELRAEEMGLLYNASTVPRALIHSMTVHQDLMCRVLGRCRHGPGLDSEIGSLTLDHGPVDPALFSYVRYDAEISEDSLRAAGMTATRPRDLLGIDNVGHIEEMIRFGTHLAKDQVRLDHVRGFIG